MLGLTTLGALDLRMADGVAAQPVLRQPRRLALLIYLALEGRSGFLRRDRVLGVFWPETTDASARRSLSQAMHFLREHLGKGVIQLRGREELRLDPALIQTDACELLAAAERRDFAAVIPIATGDFLAGFYSGGLREFDEWADGARLHIREVLQDALWDVAETAAARGELVAAGAHARRAAALCPEDEPSLRRLMQLQHRIGDRAGAVEAYEAFAARLLREYDAEPTETTRLLAQEIRNQEPPLAAMSAAPAAGPPDVAGADSSPDVSIPPAPDRPAMDPPAGAVLAQPRAARWWHRVFGWLLTLVLLLAITSVWGLRHSGSRTPWTERPAVLVEQGPTPLDALLAATVSGHLRGSGIEVLVAGNSVPGPVAPAFLVRLNLSQEDSILHAAALLVDRQDEGVIGMTSLSEPASSRADAIQRLGSSIAVFTRAALGSELERRRVELAALPPDVLEGWLSARRRAAEGDSMRLRGFQEFARVRLAGVDSQLAALQHRAPGAALLPRARAELAYPRMMAHLQPPAPDAAHARALLVQGIGNAARALELDPSDVRALEARGVLRYWSWLTAPADSDALAEPLLANALADLEGAVRGSPGAPHAWTLLSMTYQYRADFARAYEAARNAITADVFLRHARGARVRVLWSALEVGDSTGATHWCDVIRDDNPRSWVGAYCSLLLLAATQELPAGRAAAADTLRAGALSDPASAASRDQIDAVYAVLLTRAGRSGEARTLARALAKHATANDELLPDLAWIHAALGEPAEARALLDRFVAGRPARRAWIYKSWRFSGLRPL